MSITTVGYDSSPKTLLGKVRWEVFSLILYPYQDKTRDTRSNITLCLKEFTRAKPEGSPVAKGFI